MEINDIYNKLKKAFDDGIGEVKTDVPVSPFIFADRSKINAIALFLRDEESLQFDNLSCLSGVDYDKDNLAVVYHLVSYALKHSLVVKCLIPKSDPKIQTVSDVWAAADWHEREAFDLVGMTFEGHPDLRRILLPDDWEGHPLRKDFKVPEFYNGMKVPY
ncbi:MAG: NADH-quinone oxidoreductase subunit C [Bacteroidetes bacterium]|nr:NADH-quinone oxidoreductase subunit C [Bacteroidota bacterium]